MKEKLVLVKEIDFVNKESLLLKLNRISWLLFTCSLFLCWGLGAYFYSNMEKSVHLFLETRTLLEMVLFSFKWLLYCGVLFLFSIVLHEGVHGFFFKLFGAKKVRFGFKKGLFYTESVGTFYRGWQYGICVISPFFLLSIGYWFLKEEHPFLAGILFALHTSGCVIDFYLVGILIKSGIGTWVKDTDYGMTVYRERK